MACSGGGVRLCEHNKFIFLICVINCMNLYCIILEKTNINGFCLQFLIK